MATAALTRYTPEEYLALERNAEFKSEYIDGRIVAMTGASEPHNTIVGNLHYQLRRRMHDGACRLYLNDMRVQIARGYSYMYPDVVAVCGERQFADGVRDSLTNPTLIVEVLSPSTEAFDRGKKFHHYQLIDTLREYILIAQDQPRVECYTRGGEDVWFLWTETNLDHEVEFRSVGCSIPLREIYENVDFPSTANTAAAPAP